MLRIILLFSVLISSLPASASSAYCSSTVTCKGGTATCTVAEDRASPGDKAICSLEATYKVCTWQNSQGSKIEKFVCCGSFGEALALDREFDVSRLCENAGL